MWLFVQVLDSSGYHVPAHNETLSVVHVFWNTSGQNGVHRDISFLDIEVMSRHMVNMNY